MPAEPDQKTSSRRFLPWILLAALLLAGVALRQTVFAPDPIEVRVAGVARGRVES